MTGQEFRDYVVDTSFKRDDKDSEIYYATTDVIRKLLESYSFSDYKEVDASVSIVDGTDGYDLESDYEFMIGDPVLLDGDQSGSLSKVTRALFKELFTDNYNDNPNKSRPTHYCIYGKKLYVGPMPDNSYTLKYDYSTIYENEVSATTLNVPFTNLNRLMMKHLVLAVLYSDLDEYDLSTVHENKGGALYAQLVNRDDTEENEPINQQYQDI